MQSIKTLLVVGLAASLAACSAPPKMSDAEFKPILSIPADPEPLVTGSIYNGGRNDNWFGRKKDYKVGDIITVVLNEQTQANRVNNTSASRETSNNVADTLVPKLAGLVKGGRGVVNDLKLDGSEISSEATGSANQTASLTGSVAVTVTQVLGNGNLVVRGEKQLDLSEGGETIRVAGIVRSDDIGTDGTVFSRRLANAQISYTGSGDLASANKVPWGTGVLFKLWPF
jgi:flagellar L-ring protein precursor FlgH